MKSAGSTVIRYKCETITDVSVLCCEAGGFVFLKREN